MTLSGCMAAPLWTSMTHKPPPPALVKQGQPIRVDQLTVTVTDMWMLPQIRRNLLTYDPNPGGIWFVVKVHVRNDGTSHEDLLPLSQRLLMGGEHDSLSSAKRYNADMLASEDVSLDPGFEQDATLAFDIPESEVSGSVTDGFHAHAWAAMEVCSSYMAPTGLTCCPDR
jgi:Domain of unknown function (DUF4352)